MNEWLARSGSRWQPAVRELASRPPSAAAWGVVGTLAALGVMLWRHASLDVYSLCLAASRDVAGQLRAGIVAAWKLGAFREAFEGWVLMVLVMLPLLTAPLAQFVSARSFASRRVRGVALSLASVFIVWLLVGVATLPLEAAAATGRRGHALAGALAFVLAAAWQLTPCKRAALRRCARTQPLSAAGWRADRDCIVFGLRYAGGCVQSCWAMMLACALVSHALVPLLAMLLVGVEERSTVEPRRVASVLLLVACAASAATPLFLAE